MERMECGFCGITPPLNIHDPFCPRCGEPMLVHDPGRRRRIRSSAETTAEKYAEFLPLRKPAARLSLGEGETPLLPLDRLRREFALPAVFAKNEMQNPTGSFKDRGSAVAVSKAVELGVHRVGTISTGNMAGSTAAYAAKAGLRALVLVKEDTSREKIAAAAVYGAAVVRVRGDYDGLFHRSFVLGREHGIYFMNSVDPFRIEGYKVTGYEIFEQLGAKAFAGRPPRVRIYVPVSAAGHLIGLMRAFADLKKAGRVRDMPVFVGVQASGCAPVVRAFAQGADVVKRFPRPVTVAHAISNPAPPGGRLLLAWLRRHGGTMLGVSDGDILRAQHLLASMEGLFCDPAAATALAALLKIRKRTGLDPASQNVLVLTGSGLKTIPDLDPARLDIRDAGLESLDRAPFLS